jgi:exosortase E/protease (VPEID-CTERM system)
VALTPAHPFMQFNVAKVAPIRNHTLRLPLGARLMILAAVLALESFPLSLLVQRSLAGSLGDVAAPVRAGLHWGLRFLVAYAVVLFLLSALGREDTLRSLGSRHAREPLRIRFLLWHVVALIPFAGLSAILFVDRSAADFLVVAIGWHVAAVLAALFLMVGLAPLRVWVGALGRARATLVYAIAPALGSVLAIQASQMLWHPAAGLTFRMAEAVLRPILAGLQVDYTTLTIGTRQFAVQIADQCSGLEGIGLMFIFCAAWLWLFRREYYFPRALLIIPVAVVLVYLLNTVRIAALVLIGNAGYPEIAVVGFHSQAGWIAFNATALAVALIAKRSRWLNRNAAAAVVDESGPSPEATYLLPLLTILAFGMIGHAMSARFDLFYPLRFIAALGVLWVYRLRYREMNWRFGWRAVAVGCAVFLLWILCDRWLGQPHGMPAELAGLPPGERIVWIVCRVCAAIATVPLAEELAYRGFLMRRLVRREFETVSFRSAGLPALGLSAIAFGAMHGAMWLPATVAGAAYGGLAITTDRIGAAAAAHAVTNGLIVVGVLAFGQWQLW